MKPPKGLSELAELPFTEAPQKVKLWGFPGSCWADSTCRAKLTYMVIYGQTIFPCKACGQPVSGICTQRPHRWQGRGCAAWLAPGAALRVGVGTWLGTSTWL